MKYLQWFKENINLVSFTVGVVLIISGKTELGQVLLNKGVQ